jgi:membrane protease subunit HflK
MTSIREDGHLTVALLIFLKQLTAHTRWVFAVLLLLYALSGIRTIQPQETALVRRLGRLQTKLHGPGLLLGLPAPFDEVLRFDTGRDISLPLDDWALIGGKIGDPSIPIEKSEARLVAEINSPESEGAEYPQYENMTLDPVRHGYTLTRDLNVIQGRFILRYRIEDPFAYTSAGADVPALLARLARRALSIQLAARPIDASLTHQRADVAARAAAETRRAAADLGLGLRVTGLDVSYLSPPAQVLASFEDVVNARQFAKTLAENSRMHHGEMIAKAEGEAAAIHHRAQAYQADLLATARGEASAFTALLETYRQQPALIARRILRDSLNAAMSQIYSRTLIPAEKAAPSILLEPSPEFSR